MLQMMMVITIRPSWYWNLWNADLPCSLRHQAARAAADGGRASHSSYKASDKAPILATADNTNPECPYMPTIQELWEYSIGNSTYMYICIDRYGLSVCMYVYTCMVVH